MALTSDHNKKEQLLGSLAKEGHPMAKFMWGRHTFNSLFPVKIHKNNMNLPKFLCEYLLIRIGNLLSLKIRPQEKGLDLYEHLRKFHDRAYSSHYMTLAVQSRGTCLVICVCVRLMKT